MQIEVLAKAVVTKGLFDLVKIKTSSNFKYNGTPYIDSNDHLLFSKITPKDIDDETLRWFESDSTEPLSYRYWMQYCGMNPNCIRDYVKKLRFIKDGGSLEDEKEIEIDRDADPEPLPIRNAKGWLPYVRMHPHKRKWMNI